MKTRKWLGLIPPTLAVAGMVALAGCNGSSGSATGQMSLGVTDTPVDSAAKVVVAFTGVELQGPNGLITEKFSKEKTIDLLSLQGNASSQLLDNVTVDAGDYQWIRLDLDLSKSYIQLDNGNQYPLTIPSGAQTGLKLVSGFTVAQGSKTDFVIDFNLRKALTMTANQSTGAVTYILKPALRLINKQKVGSISGTASANLTVNGTAISSTSCSPSVYVYSGTSITPEGFDATVSGGTQPLTSATLKLNSNTGNYDYTVGFLAAGTYSLAVTCAANDTSGATSFYYTPTPPTSTSVTAGSTTTVDFQ